MLPSILRKWLIKAENIEEGLHEYNNPIKEIHKDDYFLPASIVEEWIRKNKR